MKMNKVKTTAKPKLRLRQSPKTGATIDVLPPGTLLDVIGEETWLKVRTTQGAEGYVLADFTEASGESSEQHDGATEQPITYTPGTKWLQGKPVRIAASFADPMAAIEQRLNQYNISMWVTSSLREPGKPVENAICRPAKMSNHLVGHAIDMNLYVGERWFNSSTMQQLISKTANEMDDVEMRVMAFFDGLRDDGLTWGGTFKPCDPVHIDDRLNLQNPGEYKRLLQDFWPEKVT